MALQNTHWLAKRLNLSVSTIERKRAQQSDQLPAHCVVGGAIRYDPLFVEWWLLKQVDSNTPEFATWHAANAVRFSEEV